MQLIFIVVYLYILDPAELKAKIKQCNNSSFVGTFEL